MEIGSEAEVPAWYGASGQIFMYLTGEPHKRIGACCALSWIQWLKSIYLMS